MTTPRPPMLVMRRLRNDQLELRQPLDLYEAACVALQEHYDKMGEAA